MNAHQRRVVNRSMRRQYPVGRTVSFHFSRAADHKSYNGTIIDTRGNNRLLLKVPGYKYVQFVKTDLCVLHPEGT